MCPVNAELKVIDFKDYKQLGQEQGDSKRALDAKYLVSFSSGSLKTREK